MNSDFRVGPSLVKRDLNLICRNGTTIQLEPKVIDVLVCLAEHPGEVLPKETLLQRVWPDTYVTDDVLRRCVSTLRRAFGDEARNPQIIETIPKRGYRLVAPVQPVNGTEKLAIPVSQSPIPGDQEIIAEARGYSTLLVTTAVIVIAAGLIAFAVNLSRSRLRKIEPSATGMHIHAIAVLPLQNVSGDPGQEYFSEGMTDALTTDLAQIGSLKVISRTSTARYKNTDKALPQIARELNVDGIVEGTVQRSGDRMRMTVQLIEGDSDKLLWANSYEADMRDVFALERHFSQAVASQIEARLGTPNRPSNAYPRRANLQSLDAYLRGNYYLNRYSRGSGDVAKRRAGQYFEQAITADANFAPAYNGLAETHLGLLSPSKQDAQLAIEAAERALALDPNYSDAHRTLAELQFASWNWNASEEEFRRAITLSPNDADAHGELGVLLDAIGRREEGWREQQLAQELDPQRDHLSDALMIRHQYDRAIAMVQMMLNRYPDDGYLHWTLFKDLAQTGRLTESLVQLQQATVLYGYPDIAAQLRRAKGYREAMLSFAKSTEHLMSTNQLFFPGNIAEVYATLGEKDLAFSWLETAYARHNLAIASTDVGLQHFNREFRFDALRSDHRFSDLLHRVGLPQ